MSDIRTLNILLFAYNGLYLFETSTYSHIKKINKVIFKTMNLDGYKIYKNTRIDCFSNIYANGDVEIKYTDTEYYTNSSTYYINGNRFDVSRDSSSTSNEIRRLRCKDENPTKIVTNKRMHELEDKLKKMIKKRRISLIITVIILLLAMLAIIGVCAYTFISKNYVFGVIWSIFGICGFFWMWEKVSNYNRYLKRGKY